MNLRISTTSYRQCEGCSPCSNFLVELRIRATRTTISLFCEVASAHASIIFRLKPNIYLINHKYNYF
jgi:hypothetical protein